MTTESGQASGQSSSNSAGQQQSQQGSAAQGGASDQGQQNQNSGGGQQQQAAKIERPAYVPEKFWDGEKNEVRAEDFGRHLNDLSAFKAEADVRKSTLPAAPDKYEVKLPDGFTPPEGMEFQFDANDPALGEARKLAHAKGWSQQDFSEALGIFATTKIAELQQTNAAREAERGKLGATADARIEAVETWLKAKVGDKANLMIATLKAFPVAANVEAFEGIIRAFSSQGGTNFSQQHREGAEDATKIPGWDKMSFEQRRFAQDQQKAAARRTA